MNGGKNESSSKKQRDPELPPTFYDSVDDSMKTINLTKLKALVITRYKALKEIYKETETKNKDKSKNNVKITNMIKDFDWDPKNELINDISSHFILALIMCRSDSEIQWFIRQEAKLFKFRIDQGKYSMYKILSKLGINLKQYNSKENKDVDINKINFRNIKNEVTNIYYCRFEDAYTLVPTHDFYLHKGFIYIPENDLPLLFRLVFESKLEQTINKIKTRSNKLKENLRIRDIINNFDRQKQYLLNQETKNLRKTMPVDQKLRIMEDVDKLSEKAFPLCMLLIERHLNEKSHLTHFGRLQYTLFLKGAGLPVDQTLKFFQEKYSKLTPIDKFEKEYAYGIRHAYGLEGKRLDYAPFSCERILKFNTPIGKECHGCPFQTYSVENLRKILSTCHLEATQIEEILNKKKTNEFQLACSLMFQAKYPFIFGTGVGVHPNSYFASVMKGLKEMKNKQKNEQKEDEKMDEENFASDIKKENAKEKDNENKMDIDP